MIKPIACILGLVIFTGCGSSNEVSNQPAELTPEQLRNNFDECVNRWFDTNLPNGFPDEKFELFTSAAKIACAGYLDKSEYQD
jgi:hypothetical protein